MKSMTTYFALALVSVILAGCFPGTMVDPAPQPTREALVGTWLALSNADGHRMDLLSDGTGRLVIAYASENGRVRRYETARWELDRYDFSAKFVSIDGDPQTVYVRAWATPDSLHDASISLSPTARDGRSPEFARESRVKDLMKALETGE
jgi:hypothetical protein